MINNELDDSGDKIQEFKSKTIIIGSRKSKLAMIQTNLVIDQLKNFYPNFNFLIKNIDTIGDNILDKPLAKIGEKALFTRELEDELLQGTIDIIVHSLKDMPTTLPKNCCIGAILKREDPSDSLVFRKGLTENIDHEDLKEILKEKDHIKTFGTSSLRRIAQLKSFSPDVLIKDVRGNLNTRLDKLDNHHIHGMDCLILATSGLKRGGFEDRISLKLDWYHAVSQGALGVECRSDDYSMMQILEPLIDQRTVLECTAERVLMKVLEGGCSVPIGVRTIWSNGFILTLQAKVLTLDGQKSVSAECSKDLDEENIPFTAILLSDFTEISCKQDDEEFCRRHNNAVHLGRELAYKMINLGAKNILKR